MAALVATQFNPAIKLFYQRLLAAGKPKTCSGRLHAQTHHHSEYHAQKGEEWNASFQSQVIS